MKIPSDFDILNTIYTDYYHEFSNYSESKPSRSTKNFVPINLKKIASKLDVDGDIVFGRMYHHLTEKYSYQKADDSWVHFFMVNFENDHHVIHFPLLASVLAGLSEERNKSNRSFYLSLAAFVISIVSVTFNYNTKTHKQNQHQDQLKTSQYEKGASQEPNENHMHKKLDLEKTSQ